MSVSLQSKILERIAISENIFTLKKQKLELKEKLKKKKKELNNINTDIFESTLIPINDCKIKNIESQYDNIGGCSEILKVEIKNCVITEKWGVLIDPFDVKDGEYYLLMCEDDFIFYKLYLNDGKIDCLWKEQWKEMVCDEDDCYGKPNCDEEDCWYEGNYDRRNEGGLTFTFPRYECTDPFVYCDVDYQNNRYEWNDDFTKNRDEIREEYERRIKRVTDPEFKECKKCKRVLARYIFTDYSFEEGDECMFCDEK